MLRSCELLNIVFRTSQPVIDFTPGEHHLKTGDCLCRSIFTTSEEMVENGQKYVCNETIVHDVWCVLLI